MAAVREVPRAGWPPEVAARAMALTRAQRTTAGEHEVAGTRFRAYYDATRVWVRPRWTRFGWVGGRWADAGWSLVWLAADA